MLSLHFFSFFSFNDLPQFVPICDAVWMITCHRQTKNEWGVGATVFGVWQCVRAYLWGALSLSLLCFVCVSLCVFVYVCVCSGEMGHRGSGRLAGTAESGGVQRHLHPTRHQRLGATSPGEERPEGTHTRLLPHLSPSVNLCEPSRPTHKLLFLSVSCSTVSLMVFHLLDVSLFCHLLRCAALLCLAYTVWLLLGERDLL